MKTAESEKGYTRCPADERWERFRKDWKATYQIEEEQVRQGRPLNSALRRVVLFSASLITLH